MRDQLTAAFFMRQIYPASMPGRARMRPKVRYEVARGDDWDEVNRYGLRITLGAEQQDFSLTKGYF